MMNLWKGTVRRVGATLLACVLLLGLLPQLPRQAGAAYTDSYLQQMVDWAVSYTHLTLPTNSRG